MPRDDSEAVTTALSTLSARVAVLERWMRRTTRYRTALFVLMILVVTLIVCIVLLATR
jgi:hypothetical protein